MRWTRKSQRLPQRVDRHLRVWYVTVLHAAGAPTCSHSTATAGAALPRLFTSDEWMPSAMRGGATEAPRRRLARPSAPDRAEGAPHDREDDPDEHCSEQQPDEQVTERERRCHEPDSYQRQ